MRIWLVSILSILLGVSAGLGLTWYEFSTVSDHFNLRVAEAGVTSAVPRVVVDRDEFDFRSLAFGKSGTHTFVIRNAGKARLDLKFQRVSCGQCVETKFKEAALEPDQTVDVEVKYSTRKQGPEFSERVELTTNAPDRPVVGLQIRGFVTFAVRASVAELTLGDVSCNEQKSAGFRLYGYENDRLEILGREFTNPDLSAFFDVQTRPLSKADFSDEPLARVAQGVTVTTKSGLPLGPINQTIRFQVQAAEKNQVEVPVRGTVVSDIALVGGAGFEATKNLLYFGSVLRAEGAKANLKVLVKGPYRDQVQVRLGEVDPKDALRATLGERSRIANGAIYLYPLTVQIAKDAPPVNRLGSSQGKSGVVMIETTHPQAKQLRLLVRFATE